MEEWIKDSVALVTGGSSGIGAGIARKAALLGARVVVADLDWESGEEVCNTIQEQGGTAVFIRTDITNRQEVRELVQQAAGYGPLKYIANSAGIQTYGTVETTTEEDWDNTLNVNLKSMFLVCHEALPVLKSNGGGGIVNISSIQAFVCQKNVLAYATAKGAVVAMTRSMGIDHAAEGVYVNCICPGSVDTPMLQYGASQFGNTEDVIREWGMNHPIGRVGSVEEIAETAMFLWSPASNFIVGQAIRADGGLGSVIF